MSAEIQLGWNNGKLQAGAAGAAAIVNKAAAQMRGALGGIGSGLSGGLGLTPLLGVAGAVGAAVGATVIAVKSLADEYDHIWDVSQRLNETPESIQRIGLMAKLAGTDLDATAKAIQKMNLELRKGADSEGVKALKMMGLDAADLIKLSPEKQIAALAAAFQKAQASGIGFVEVQTLLGKKFSDLLPILRANSEELRSMSESKAVSDEDVETIAKANDAWDEYKHNVGTKVTSALVGAYDKMQLINTALENTERTGWTSISMWESFTEQLKIAEDIQRKDAIAAEMLSEKLRRQQRDLDAITAAQSAANDEANESIKKSKEQAAAIDKVSKSYEEQAKKANASRDALRNARNQTRDDYTTPEQKLEDAKQRVLELDKQINAVSGQDNGTEITNSLLAEQEREKRLILQLGKEILADQERSNQEAADAAKAIADQKAGYESNLAMLDLELEILNAQASGHDRKAKQLEHQRDVQEETALIVEATGLAYDDAARKAEQLVSAKEKADGRGKGEGGRSKIHGYSQEQGNYGDARARAEKRGTDSRETANKRVLEYMGMGSLAPSRLTPRGDIGARTPATDTPAASGESELATLFKQYSDKTVEIFERALA